MSDLWFQRLAGFPLRDLSVRDFLCAGDDVLLARGSALSFCSRRVRTCNAPGRHFAAPNNKVASLIGRLGSSTFRPSTPTVSMSLAGSCFSSESALRPFHHGIRRRGGTIYWTALPSVRTAGPSDIANSPHPSSREGHHSTAGWSSSFLLSDVLVHGFHAATAACSRVQRNSVPSTQIMVWTGRAPAE